MSLKVSVNGFWPIAFVNKNSTLYTKLSPYCAISNGNEELNGIISDSFESDNNGKFVDIPKSLKLSTGDETVDVSGYLRPKKEKWFQVKERAESYRVYSKVLFTASSMAPSVPKTAVSTTIQKSSNLDAMDITVDCCDRDGNVKEFVEKIQNVLNDISKERIATHVPVSVQLISSSVFQNHDAAILQQIGFIQDPNQRPCPLSTGREDTLLQAAAFSPSLPYSHALRPPLAQQLNEPPAPLPPGSGPPQTPPLIPLSGPPQPTRPHPGPPQHPLGPLSAPPLGLRPPPGHHHLDLHQDHHLDLHQNHHHLDLHQDHHLDLHQDHHHLDLHQDHHHLDPTRTPTRTTTWTPPGPPPLPGLPPVQIGPPNGKYGLQGPFQWQQDIVLLTPALQQAILSLNDPFCNKEIKYLFRNCNDSIKRYVNRNFLPDLLNEEELSHETGLHLRQFFDFRNRFVPTPDRTVKLCRDAIAYSSLS